ncbi:hypothetical protein Trydic_g23328 [Trypoxylus dichotomus]
MLLHDNARSYTLSQTKVWLQKHIWVVIVRPPHSPDLALPDFHLFGLLKTHLCGERFEDDDELEDKAGQYFNIWIGLSTKRIHRSLRPAGISALILATIILRSS